MSGRTQIHPTAIIDPHAQLADGVSVGPYSIIEKNARVGADTIVESQVTIKADTVIGQNCHLFIGSVIGHLPQDAKYKGEDTRVVLGNHNIIREYVTIHRATMPGGQTIIGDHNMIMAYCHVGHDCQIGNRVVIASYGGISGHVTIEDYVNIGGMVGIHQFVHVGKLAMIGGITKVTQDVPPFVTADGRPMQIVGLNMVGLRRSGMPSNERSALRLAYQLLFRSHLNTTHALERIVAEVPSCEPVNYLLDFMRRTYGGRSGRQDQPV